MASTKFWRFRRNKQEARSIIKVTALRRTWSDAARLQGAHPRHRSVLRLGLSLFGGVPMSPLAQGQTKEAPPHLSGPQF